MHTITVHGWVRSGNRWLARLMAYYGDHDEAFNALAFYLKHYWFKRAEVSYFGEPMQILVSGHIPEPSLPREDEWAVHISRDPRDAFVSWYHMLTHVDNGVWTARRREWKDFLPWLIEQRECDFRAYTERWLDFKERHPPRVSWIQHEALYSDRAGGLLRLVGEMGFRQDKERVQRAALLSEHEPTRPSYIDPRKMCQQGLPGQWVHFFDAQDARFVNEHYGDLMARLGYGGDKCWISLLQGEII